MAASTSGPGRGAPAGPERPACTASASSSTPSREPRSRRSGQVSSWTPATTTTSHSRPLDRCAVRMRTQSSLTARSASVSPAISCPDRLSANRPGAPGGMLSAKCAALSNRASTASRSRSAAAPAGPPAALSELPLRRQAGGVPDGPEHVLGAAAFLDGVPGRGEQPGDALGGTGHPVRHHGQVPRVEQRVGQHVPARRLARASRVGVGQQLQGPAQAAQAEGVGAAERAAEQLGGGLLVQLGRAQRAAQQHQQRPGAGFVGQRQLVPGHRDRDVGRGQRPAQQRHLPGRRAHQDGHRRPGHPVGQVGAAQRVGDQRGLLGRAVRDQDADLAGRGAGHRNQVTVAAGAAGAPGRAARPGSRGPPGGTRPAGPGRCGGRRAAPPPAPAGRPRCGTGQGTR